MQNLMVGLIIGIGLTLWFQQVVQYVFFTSYWLRARLSGGDVSPVAIIRMRYKGCPVRMLNDSYCAMIHMGYNVEVVDIETFYMANRFVFSEHDPARFLERIKRGFERMNQPKAGDASDRTV